MLSGSSACPSITPASLPQFAFSLFDQTLVEKGTANAEVARGTPTQSHLSPSILVYDETRFVKDEVGIVGGMQSPLLPQRVFRCWELEESEGPPAKCAWKTLGRQDNRV